MIGRELAYWLKHIGTGMIVGGVVVGVMMLVVLLTPAHAAERVRPVQIPAVAVTYRLKIEREAVRNFGLQAPVARLAAQIHQESGWRTDARSPYAHGLAQFTPATARWLPSVCPAVGAPDPWDPDWSLRAQACYVAWLYARQRPFRYAGAFTDCARWNFTLRAYNGGEGWLLRERLLTQTHGGDANAWREVAAHRVRALWAHQENIAYPRRILLTLEPAYIAAGWAGEPVC